MTKKPPKQAWKPKKWSKKRKPAYRKPSPSSREKRKRARDLDVRMDMMELMMGITRQQQAAFFHALDSRQQVLVLAYEEE